MTQEHHPLHVAPRLPHACRARSAQHFLRRPRARGPRPRPSPSPSLIASPRRRGMGRGCRGGRGNVTPGRPTCPSRLTLSRGRRPPHPLPALQTAPRQQHTVSSNRRWDKGQRGDKGQTAKSTQTDTSPSTPPTTSPGTWPRPSARQRALSSGARSPCPCPRTRRRRRASCARQGGRTPAGSRPRGGACACGAAPGRTCAPCGRPGTLGMLVLPPPPHHCSSR